MLKDKYTSEDILELREIFLRRVEDVDSDGSAAIALSGGIDSVGVLFAELELGRKPRCYTFYADRHISSDIKASRNICSALGLELTEIVIPTDVDTMYRDVRRVIPHLCKVKKTNVECTIPWLYAYPAIKEDIVLTGLAGDDFFCNNRKANVMLGRVGEDGMLDYRRQHVKDIDNADKCILDLAKTYGKTAVDFYDFPEAIEWFMQFTLRSLNRPFQKAPLVYCWRDWYAKGAFYKKHSSLQVDSRLRDFYQELLASKYNTGGHRAVSGLYNQIAKEVGRNE